MKDFSVFLDMREYKNWAYKVGSWKYLSASFSQSTEHLTSALYPECLSGGV